MSEGETFAPAFADGEIRENHLALYRKYRSRNLDEVLGQPQVTEVLSAAANQRNFAHAYLLTGQRGTGKTSVARILAHLMNQTPYDPNMPDNDFDIIEIDAASHGSVDDARELRDKANLAPLKSPYKIYIIDEVHMLSRQAFDALLKLIEEPPEHLRFILATTEIQKVPATILSRVQRFHFRPVPAEIVAKHLREISGYEKINIDDEALNLVAERGGGSFRDSITLLDQLSNTNEKISRNKVEEILGLAPENSIREIIKAIQSHNITAIVKLLSDFFADGLSAGVLTSQLIAELAKLAPEQPKLYNLIEKLLEVAKSAAPDLKLTAILVESANDTFAKSSAEFTKPKTLSQVATAPKTDEKLAGIIEKDIAKEIRETKPQTNLSWDEFAKSVAEDFPAVASVLKKSDYEFRDGELTIFLPRKFDFANVKKHLAKLNEFAPDMAIKLENFAKPLDPDSPAGQVLGIMGGGEIVRHGEI